MYLIMVLREKKKNNKFHKQFSFYIKNDNCLLVCKLYSKFDIIFTTLEHSTVQNSTLLLTNNILYIEIIYYLIYINILCTSKI